MDNYRLILNIDCVGEDIDPIVVVEVCKRFFNNIEFNISTKPSFPMAVKWVWKKIESNYFFHLEDDWEINEKFDINILKEILDSNHKLASVRLPVRKLKVCGDDPNMVKSRGLFYKATDFGYCIGVDRGRSFSLNPSLIRKDFVKDVVSLIVDTRNPEKQFRKKDPVFGKYVVKWDYALYGNPGQKPLVSGLFGLSWTKNRGLVKPNKNEFLTYERKR